MASQIITIQVDYNSNHWESENDCKEPGQVYYESAIDTFLQNKGDPHITRHVKILSVSPVRYAMNEGPDAVGEVPQ